MSLKSVMASAPGKLMLFGEHAVVYGTACIVTAVDQRLSVKITKNGKDAFHLEAPDLGLSAYSKTISDLGKKNLPKSVRFIELLYKRFLEIYPQKEGIDVVTKSEFSSSFGFGSSSAVSVAFAYALARLYKIKFSKRELFDLCYQAVIDVQGVGSGFDLAAAIWGGTLYYVPPAKRVEKLSISRFPMVVGYTGVGADTPTLIRLVASLKGKKNKKVDEIFSAIESIVERAKGSMELGDWESVGLLMQENQKLLKKLQVSSVELDRLIRAAEGAGSWGAKLSGAGGGDCMIAVCSIGSKSKIIKAIEKVGGEVMDVGLGAEGVRIESS